VTSHPSDEALPSDSGMPRHNSHLVSSSDTPNELQPLPPAFELLFSNETIQRFREHEQFIFCATLSSTGSAASASLEHGIQLWHTDKTSIVHHFTSGRMDSIISLALSPDGNRIVSGSADGTIRIWDVETSHRQGTQPEAGMAINTALASPPERSILLSDDWNVPRLNTSGWIVDDENNLLLWVPDEYKTCFSEIVS
jgi:WD40 repeat protein